MTTGTAGIVADTTRVTRAWQDGVDALLRGYTAEASRLAQFATAIYGAQWPAMEQMMQGIDRLNKRAWDVASAQNAVAGEWLRAPLWLIGAVSPADLQAVYFRLFDAYRDLAYAWIDTAVDWQRALTGVAEQAAEAARDVVDTDVQTARRVANDARETGQASVDAARSVAAESRRLAARVVEEATEIVEHARETAEHAAERVQDDATAVSDEQRLHQLGLATVAEVAEAEAAPAATQSPAEAARPLIKGKINREGERIYHAPGQMNYERVEADVLFESEEAAREAGFRPAQR